MNRDTRCLLETAVILPVIVAMATMLSACADATAMTAVEVVRARNRHREAEAPLLLRLR